MQREFIAVALGVFLFYSIPVGSQPPRGIHPGSDIMTVCEGGIDCSNVPVVASGIKLYYSLGKKLVGLNSRTGEPFWTFSLKDGNLVASNVMFLHSFIFFASMTDPPCGPIYALAPETGRIIWSKDISSCYIWSDGEHLYLQGGSGDGDGIRAIDPTTGAELWHAEGDAPQFVQTLAVRHGLIYTNDRVLDARTGKTMKWWPKDEDISSLAANKMVVLTGGRKGVLSAFDAATLEQRWRSTLLSGKDVVAILINGKFTYAVGYIGKSNGTLVAFDTSNGQQMWNLKIHSCCQNLDLSPVAEGGGKLFLLTPEDKKSGTKLIALDSRTGKPLWSYCSETTLQGPPALEGETLYLKDSKGALTALDPVTGKSIWEYEP